MVKFTALLALLLSFISLGAQDLNLIPYPREINLTGNHLNLKSTPNIKAIDGSLIPLAELLTNDIFKITGVIVSHDLHGAEDITLALDHTIPANEYQISITDAIRVKGSNYHSVALGVTTLIQLLSMEGNNLSFPKLTIRDSPSNEFRCLMVDVARRVIDCKTLKQSVELCRFYKIPYMQIHISDDQAFCFPSTHYPELATAGHSYTLTELTDLVDFATIRGVTIIPELDGPGHSTAIRAANPAVFGSTAFSALDLVSDTTYQGLKVLLGEMLSVFHTSPWFHIGADEAGLNDAFLNTSSVKAFMSAKGYNADDLQRMYVVRMDSIVRSLGAKTMAWESFKADNSNQKVKIPTDILVNCWETMYELPQNYVKTGFNIINTSWKPYYTTRDKRWHPEYIYNFTKFSFANHWKYAPSFNPFEITPTQQVKGGQMCVWEQFDVQIVSGVRNRIPAFSEYYWLEDKRPGYADYASRFTAADKRFEQLLTACRVEVTGTNQIPEQPVEWKGEVLPNPNGVQTNFQYWFSTEAHLKITPVSPDITIYYTTNGSQPTPSSKVMEGDLTISRDTHVRLIAWRDSIIGYQQYLFEQRPVRATLEGLKPATREVEPYAYNTTYVWPLKLRFDTIADPDVEIRYTLNGTTPNRLSAKYLAPVEISALEEKTIRARAYKNGQVFGQEWRPADYYDNVQYYAPDRYYRFSGMDPVLNLTTNKPILSATGYYDETQPPSNINDGIISNENFWHSGSGFPQSLTMDLEASYLLGRFHVWTYWEDGRQYQYRIEASPDNAHWTILVDNTTNTQPSTSAGFDHVLAEPFEARYLRMVVTNNSANSYSHVVELYAWQTTSGVQDASLQHSLELFPNPAHDTINIRYDGTLGPLSLDVVSNDGTRVDSLTIEKDYQFKFKQSVKGSLFIFIFKRQDGSVAAKRVVRME